MEENAIKTSITKYKFQLEQVDQAIQAAGETDDLVTLRGDLLELIKLTEESLLSLKKGQLLKQLDDADVESNAFDRDGQSSQTESNGKSTTTSGTSEMDEEYAAFQAMLGGDVICSDPVTPALEGETSATGSNIADIYQDIVGTKCQAPFIHEWGEKSYGNALIAGFETLSDVELPKVRVMFCNPTHVSMLPCRYHLEGSCKFTEDKCRFSHGHIVDLEELQEYQEPDYSLLKMEASCLARYDTDDIWYKATVVDMDDDSVTVMFKSYEDESSTLAFHDVLPILSTENDQDSSDSDEDIKANKKDDTDNDDDSLPVFLWKPPSYGLGDLGQWEAHTKGIGSKLMTQMGYVPGEGLGKNGEGRIEPVPIQLLPPGKSLDKIMRLKELAGGSDMFDVMKKQEKQMKKQAEKHAQGYQRQYKPNMFDFINKKLGGKKGKSYCFFTLALSSRLFGKQEQKITMPVDSIGRFATPPGAAPLAG